MQEKRLYIMRHAKAEDRHIFQQDIDRNLNPRGISDAQQIGDLLKDKNVSFDLIYASPANRTCQTANIIKDTIPSKIELNEDIYLADVRSLLNIICQTSDHIHSLLVVGHNPTMCEIVNYLANEVLIQYKTSCISCLAVNINSWRELSKDSCTMQWQLTPQKNP